MSRLFTFGWFKAASRSRSGTRKSVRRGRGRRHAHCAPPLEVLEDRTVPSTLTVTNNFDTGVAGDGSLRGEIAAAQIGDAINFASNLAGQTITLTQGELALNKSLGIEGLGADRLTVSGHDTSRVFDILPGTTVTIAGLTITGGRADLHATVLPGEGGGILNQGDLTLTGDVVSGNQAIGDVNVTAGGFAGGAVGGGVANIGTLTVTGSTFTANQARGADGSSGDSQPGTACGGGLCNQGVATVTGSQFTSNLAQGGNHCSAASVDAGDASGGAIHNGILNFTATLTVSGCSFTNNRAIGGNDNVSAQVPPILGYAGLGIGGAIDTGFLPGPTLKVSGSSFTNNQAIGGNDNQGTNPDPALGGGLAIFRGNGTISNSTFVHNQAIGGQGGAGSDGGEAAGGGISVIYILTPVNFTVSNCTVDDNSAIGGQGGAGGNGGNALGGGIVNLIGEEDQPTGATLTVTGSTIDSNQAQGGDGGEGGNGGNGLGGGLYNDALSTATVTASVISQNEATGGSDGQGIGGGVYNLGTLDLVTTLIALNHASTSNNDIFTT